MQVSSACFQLIFECAKLQHLYHRLAVEILIEEVYEPYFSEGTYEISAEESTEQGNSNREYCTTLHKDYYDLLCQISQALLEAFDEQVCM